MSVSLHPVISFSVINYVVSMRCLTRVTRLIFFVPSRGLWLVSHLGQLLSEIGFDRRNLGLV